MIAFLPDDGVARPDWLRRRLEAHRRGLDAVGGAITKAAVEIGEVVDAKFLITFSETGDSAQRMSRVRPHLPMLVFTSDARTRSRLALVWGIETYLVPRMHHTDQFAMQVDLKLLPEGRVVEIGTVREIFDTPQQPYTRRLLAAGLDPDPEVQKARRLAVA